MIDFWTYVNISSSDSCWKWNGSYHQNGKGRVKDSYAHRVAFSLYYAKSIDGIRLQNSCENIACVNPNHYWEITPENVFWDRVIVNEEGCWGWKGFIDHQGYSKFDIERKPFRAHRFSYSIHNGNIPRGLFVLHECDNPTCTKPSHLKLGTQKDNISDASKRGRMFKTKESNVRDIVKMYESETMNITDLSRKYGHARSTIRNILKRENVYVYKR